MKWMVPYRKLDEFQREIIRKCVNWSITHTETVLPQWIQGFAGSGKSVLLVYIAMGLLEKNPKLSICVLSFTHALKDLLKTGFTEKYHEKIEVMTYFRFLGDRKKYDFVLVDEIQDIPSDTIEKIKGLAGHMVVAGDNDQSIYKKCSTVEEIEEVLNPEIHHLVNIYRLTKKIKAIVQTILPNSQIENVPTMRMQEVDVTLAKAESEDEEIKWVWEKCCQYAEVGDPSVILIPTHVEIQNFIQKICKIEGIDSPIFLKERGRYDYKPTNELFLESDVDLRYLGNNFGELSDSDNHALTYIMTYHSAKGLDFRNVFLPHLDKDQSFNRDSDLERNLFFVAMTRSRLNLFLSHSSEEPIHYVAEFPQDLLHKISCNSGLSEYHIKEIFLEKIVGLFENKTDIKGEVITAIIEKLLKDVITEKLIAQYQKDSLQNILSKIEDITDDMEAKDVYNQIESIINDILSNENDNDQTSLPF